MFEVTKALRLLPLYGDWVPHWVPHWVAVERFGALFDARHYRGQVATLGRSERELVSHYESVGASQGLSPSPLFSVEHYVAQAGDEAILDPLGHFRSVGWRQGLDPHPCFSSRRWLAKFSQEVEQLGDPVSHYLMGGWRSGYSPSDFVALKYAESRLPLMFRGRVEPLSYILKQMIGPFNRPHPCVSESHLMSRLRQRRIEPTPNAIWHQVAEWDAPWSPSPLFDTEFYEATYPESAVHPRGPFGHFLETGQYQDFDPNPYFNSNWYRSRYGRKLSGESPFLHYMTQERTLRFDPGPDFSTRHYYRSQVMVRRRRLSPLEHFLERGCYTQATIQSNSIPAFVRDQILEAAEFDGEIRGCLKTLPQLKVYNRHFRHRVTRLFAILKTLIDRPFSAVVFVPFLSRGGADLEAIHLVRWLQETRSVDDVLLVLTDSDVTKSLDWLPPGTRTVVFSHLSTDISESDRIQLVQLLIETYRPEVCHNVNSRVMWKLVATKGKALSLLTRLHATLFCFDYDAQGRRCGYAVEYLPQSIEHLDSICVDNDAFRRAMIEELPLPKHQAGKIHSLYSPTKPFGRAIGVALRIARLSAGKSRPQVMWAGRLDRQKRPELLVAIAARMPECDFHVFGGHVLDQHDPLTEVSSNVIRHGEYREFFELPIEDMDCYLYTAAWDGIPNALIDAMQSGLPIVTPHVGGISELVDETTGWPVHPGDDPEAYVATLRSLFADPQEALHRVERGLDRLVQQHSWETYAARSAMILDPVARRSTPVVIGGEGALVR